MIEWITDPAMRRRAQIGLNKGEAHHALKRALNFHQRGELRDRTGEGQHYRIASLNLLAAIVRPTSVSVRQTSSGACVSIRFCRSRGYAATWALPT